ncbi:protein mono-ADP-ribosyltransferase PARP16 isoform X2 [Phasianus colchicus]|uniref:protein mono-ADP-ribosyltransferase PARP16 isoform X2 n=1 Tax=Phasianus colchicus TaxID=9054 RepID=UPI00129DC37E|nr:protein mono-ADP-ribosyltransferase PARP16 isoform X2 [Phasianus colchicus]
MRPPCPGEAVREAVRRDPLGAELRCSLFAAALQSYRRDSALRPFPSRYGGADAASKDFEALLADTEALPSLKELLRAVPNEEKRTWDLLSWILSSKTFTIHSIKKQETSLFGEGTYLTSDLSLALLYSPHGLGWQRSTLGSILSCVAVCEIIDHPDVKCQVKKKDSEEIDRKRARVKNSEGGDVPQKYFVVTNNQLLRVKYLLVYSQKQHRRPSGQSSWFSTHRFAITMMLYLLLLIVIGASNSPAFLYYWHRMFHSEG